MGYQYKRSDVLDDYLSLHCLHYHGTIYVPFKVKKQENRKKSGGS